MSNNFNILVTSISKKVPLLKAVRHGIDNLTNKGKLFGADSSDTCVGCFFVDQFWQMPGVNELKIEDLIEYCKKNHIKAIIPTRDGELPFFSTHQSLLMDNGIACMISPSKTIGICLNKLLFYRFLSELELPAIPTANAVRLVESSSYVVKECFGAGSQSIGLNLPLTEAKTWAEKLKVPIFQPYIHGQDYSVDMYINRHHEPQGAIVRSRDLVIHGESQITSSLIDKEIEAICLKAAIHLGIYGHAVFQIIRDNVGKLHIIECNPRFGGASTLSLAMGLNSFEWFIKESLGQPLPPFERSKQEMRQVRYPEDKVFLL